MYIATVSGYDYIFNFKDQTIDIDAGLDSLSNINLYTAIKEAQASEEGIAFPRIATGGGLDSLSATTKTFLTVTLLDSWVINTLKVSGYFQIDTGNLIRLDGGIPIEENPLITYINSQSQAGVLVESGVSGLTPEEGEALTAIGATMLTLSRFKSLFFNRRNTVAAQKITEYVAGDLTEEEVTVDVAYDDDGVPTAETLR